MQAMAAGFGCFLGTLLQQQIVTPVHIGPAADAPAPGLKDRFLRLGVAFCTSCARL